MGKLSLTGGENKKKKLKVPKGVRPTRAIVKRSIFDTLRGIIEGSEVLEIFAGSGAVGFEALSRGAKSCFFIEKSRDGALAIIENARNIGILDRVKVFKGDYVRGLNDLIREGKKFDLIFADPPYDFDFHEEIFSRVSQLLKPDGIYVVEVRNKTVLPERPEALMKRKEVYFGQTKVVYYCLLSGDF